MTLIRQILSKIILFFDSRFSPKPLVRTSAAQKETDEATRALSLYQFEGCPFCVKVRRNIKRLGLKIEFKDAQNDPTARQELLSGGGELQVPCLKIREPNGTIRWMYESSDINQFLEQKFSH